MYLFFLLHKIPYSSISFQVALARLGDVKEPLTLARSHQGEWLSWGNTPSSLCVPHSLLIRDRTGRMSSGLPSVSLPLSACKEANWLPSGPLSTCSCIQALARSCCCPVIKRWSSFPHLLGVDWFCDLLRLAECRSDCRLLLPWPFLDPMP